ncbi:hypothetical protein JCM5350_007021 [Sporobolomyces pararoseus]
MYSMDSSSSSIRSGTVPLPPTSPARRFNQSTSSPLPHSTRSRPISLPSTTQDPMLFNAPSGGTKGRSDDEGSIITKDVSSSHFTTRDDSGDNSTTRRSADSSGRRTRTRSEQSSRVKGVREPPSAAVGQELPGRDWAQSGSVVEQSTGPRDRNSTASYTVSTASSRSSYSSRPSHPFFQPTHSRDVSSSTSLPSSQLHFPIPSTSSFPIEPILQPNNLRPRTSSLSYSRARTPSNGSTASSASSDFPITPAIPTSTSRRRISTTTEQNRKEKGISEDWSNGLPVLGGSHSGKGPAMVDPRFTFPRSRQQGLTSSTGRILTSFNQDSHPIGPFGETRKTSEDKGNLNERSFIASLGSKPFVDSTGHELPIFSASPPTQTTSYLPTSPLQPAFPPPSPFSPTSPIASISETPQRPTISTFLPHFASSSPTKTARKSPSKRRSNSFTRRVRRRSSPRKLPSHRRASSSSSPHRRQTSRSSSLHHHEPSSIWTRTLRHRSHSVPDLRIHARSQSVPTPIPFDTFSPRSPYAHEPGSRRPSIADELLFEKGKGKEGERSTSIPLAPQVRQASPTIPSRSLQPKSVSTRPKAKRTASSIPAVKGSLMLPHPKVIVSYLGKVTSDKEDSVEAIQKRYREGGEASTLNEPLEILDSLERRKTIEGDEESIDHSSVLRVLRENEESRKEREAWSDSATKTLGLGLGLKLAEFERKRSTRGAGNIAFGGAGAKVKQERKKARKQVEKDKRRAAESGTDGEGGPNSPRRRRQAAESSPPMPHSFEPFVHLTRKLSLSRSKSRDLAIKEDKAGITGGVATRKSDQDLEAPSTPRTVRGKPIRHLRTSPSVDSIFSRNGPPLPPHVCQNDSDTQYGQAVSFDDSLPLSEEHRRPSLTTQNAFLSLPPHLHHLLRSPERETYEPSRAPPPIPPSQYSLSQDSNRLSTSSVASAARLSLALENHLSKLPSQASTPTIAQSTNAKTPEITESRLNRSTSTPALLCDSSPRSSPESASPSPHETQGVRLPVQSHSLSPLPEVESPDSHRSAQTLSDASSRLNVDNRNEWKELFFSPPRRPVASTQNRTDPTVMIQVASDDETSTEGTDDTFSIHRLERTRKSLEALFAPASSSQDLETAQETLLLPTKTVAPSFARSTSHLSSAQQSFVTAQESASDDGAQTPRFDVSRPLPTPSQTPWSSTSFAREYLDDLGGSNRISDPTSLISKRASSRASRASYIDFEADVDEDQASPSPEAIEPSRSPLSFLDDFSPPPSAPPSPAIDSFPTAPVPPAPSLPITDPVQPDSLPTSPTLSSTFTEDDSTRFSRLPPNRDSYLSVDSQNLHISPTSARFVNGGGGGGGSTPRTHSFNSSKSNFLHSYPVPPVEERDETGSNGDDEAEAEEEDTRVNLNEIARTDEGTLRFEPTSPESSRANFSESTSAVSSPTATSGSSPTKTVHSLGRPATSQSFLDVSDLSDSESKRWSRGTFQTFYSGSKTEEPIPPLPSFRY